MSATNDRYQRICDIIDRVKTDERNLDTDDYASEIEALFIRADSFLGWLLSLDYPTEKAREARRTVTLTEIIELARDAQGPASGEAVQWNFWLPDADRSAGWTNHCYVLQFVCAGMGRTPEEAWESAKRGEVKDLAFPGDDAFHLPDTVVAIREDAERPLEVE